MSRILSTWPLWPWSTRRNDAIRSIKPRLRRARVVGMVPVQLRRSTRGYEAIMAIQTKPQDDAGLQGRVGLGAQGLAPKGEVHWNLTATVLIENAVRRGEGQFADMGPFCAVTAPHTGRSPNDKFLVQEPASQGDVDWG